MNTHLLTLTVLVLVLVSVDALSVAGAAADRSHLSERRFENAQDGARLQGTALQICVSTQGEPYVHPRCHAGVYRVAEGVLDSVVHTVLEQEWREGEISIC